MWWQLLPTSVGIWLMLAPYALGYVGTSAGMNDRIVGPFIACFAVVAMGEATRSVRFWNMPLGAWLVISAFVVDYPPAGVVSAILCGLLSIVLPLKSFKIDTRYAGGWKVLLRSDPYNVSAGSADRPASPEGDHTPAKQDDGPAPRNSHG